MAAITLQEMAELAALSHEQINNFDYETAIKKLDACVRALEQEGTSLEMGLKLYAVGTALNKKCSGMLDEAEEKMLQLLGTIQNPAEAKFDPEKDGR